jgi:gamma-glutamyltranspeptidase/glutathione hydrolase
MRAPVRSEAFVAVTGQAAATRAALAAYKAGGSVVDAAVAGSAALAVVFGQATSIGGDCFALYHDAASGKTFGLNASGIAPLAATPDVFKDGMKVRGPLAAAVPGLVKAWDELHLRFGRLAWCDLLADAIRLADGHAIAPSLAVRIPESADVLAKDPGCSEVFLPGGRAVAPGETFVQPMLARSLREIAREGAAAFYSGDLARRIAGGVERAGGLITLQDLQSYTPLWVEPVTGPYRAHDIMVMPPNSCGALLLLQLNGLSAVSSDKLASDTAFALGCQMSAMKEAFAVGTPLISDPRAIPDAVMQLLSNEMAARMQSAVRDGSTASRLDKRGGGTACVMAADRDGNAIVIVQSVYNGFGSMFLEPETGILFNNRMQDFDHRPGLPNGVGPGRRPFHTLCPILVMRDGRPRFALASPGGISQTIIGAQVISSIVDGRRNVLEAVEAPRWCIRKDGELLIESSFDAGMIPLLARMGHEARHGGEHTIFGSAKAIEITDGWLAGACDSRREAVALGV